VAGPESSSSQAFRAYERDYIRGAMGMHFGHYRSLADGMFLRPWRSGPLRDPGETAGGGAEHAGAGPRRDPASASGMTGAGMAALRETAQDRRALDPARFPQLPAELRLDQAGDGDA
jgi:hypothetical protein